MDVDTRTYCKFYWRHFFLTNSGSTFYNTIQTAQHWRQAKSMDISFISFLENLKYNFYKCVLKGKQDMRVGVPVPCGPTGQTA